MPLFWKPPGVQAMPEGGGSHRGSRVFFNHRCLLKNSAKRRLSSVSLCRWSNCVGSISVLENGPPMLSVWIYTMSISTNTHMTEHLTNLPREFKWQNFFFLVFQQHKKQWPTQIKIPLFVPLLLLLSGTICEGICGACCQWCDVDPWQSKQSVSPSCCFTARLCRTARTQETKTFSYGSHPDLTDLLCACLYIRGSVCACVCVFQNKSLNEFLKCKLTHFSDFDRINAPVESEIHSVVVVMNIS